MVSEEARRNLPPELSMGLVLTIFEAKGLEMNPISLHLYLCVQAILVVSEEARRNLPPELSMGLVLTIFEAKGLEFDDILLYNFFKDSQVSHNYVLENDVCMVIGFFDLVLIF